MPTKPGDAGRRVPDRGSTRPGVRRGHRPTGAADEEAVAETTGSSRSESAPRGGGSSSHAAARSQAISALALGMTYRIIALVATVAVLAISFVSSFSVYLDQQRDIAEARAQIADHESQIARLEDEFARWQDPAYVRAQARDRLGWVVPGEVGYRVIDAQGEVIGGTVGDGPALDAPAPAVWYEQLWASVVTADQPPPAEPTNSLPSAPATVGPDATESPR